LVACGTLLGAALAAASRLALEGIDVSVVNARFVKPLDPAIVEMIEASPWTITVEENALPTGFGSAILEAVNDARLPSGPVLRMGLPDRFVEHGERGELLAELGLDADGIAAAARSLSGRDAQPVAAAAVDVVRP
jgi:1-deoxy-D-xylulose-5-phosphate synthase